MIDFFHLSALEGDPRGTDGAEPKVMDAIMQTAPSLQPPPQIAPYGDVAFNATFLRPMNSAANASERGRSCLNIAVVVTQVRFSDGELWHSNGWKDFQALWTGSIQPESTEGCTQTEQSGSTLKEVKGFSIAPRAAAKLASVPVKSYSVVCPVKNFFGEERAVCDW